MSPEEELRRGEEAAFILSQPIYREAMEKLQKDIIDRWAACSAMDMESREWLWNHYQVALKFEESLKQVMTTGKLASETIRQRTLMEKAKDFFK